MTGLEQTTQRASIGQETGSTRLVADYEALSDNNTSDVDILKHGPDNTLNYRHRASTEHSLTFRVRTMSSYRGADASL